jgi:hypothetical protein
VTSFKFYSIEQDVGAQLQEINRQLTDLTYKDTLAHQRKDSAHEEVRQLKNEKEGMKRVSVLELT